MVTFTITSKDVLVILGVLGLMFIIIMSLMGTFGTIISLNLMNVELSGNQTMIKQTVNDLINSTSYSKVSQGTKDFIKTFSAIYYVWVPLSPIAWFAILFYIVGFTRLDLQPFKKAIREMSIWLIKRTNK